MLLLNKEPSPLKMGEISCYVFSHNLVKREYNQSTTRRYFNIRRTKFLLIYKV